MQKQTENIGIEVASAVQKEVREMESLFSRLTNTQEPNQIREKRKNRIQRLGGEFYDEGYMSCGIGYKDLSDVYSSFEDKLKKLNSGVYHLFQKQFAFIFDYNLIREGKLGEIHTELSKRQKRFQTHFSSVFLYLYGGNLYEFDMQSGSSCQYMVDDVMALADKAAQMFQGVY